MVEKSILLLNELGRARHAGRGQRARWKGPVEFAPIQQAVPG